MRGNFVDLTGKSSGEKILKQLHGAGHTLAAEEKEGQVKESKGKDPAQPGRDMIPRRPFLFAAVYTDDAKVVPHDQQALHSAPGHISPSRPVPEAAEQKNDESIQ